MILCCFQCGGNALCPPGQDIFLFIFHRWVKHLSCEFRSAVAQCGGEKWSRSHRATLSVAPFQKLAGCCAHSGPARMRSQASNSVRLVPPGQALVCVRRLDRSCGIWSTGRDWDNRGRLWPLQPVAALLCTGRRAGQGRLRPGLAAGSPVLFR